ncbi:MAG TPA: DinB family protein [Acidobacteriaceae bacterium]|nr:DinB family protein [Acidobacteriaceae bacterium]
MTIAELFLLEFDEEMPATRRMLERVPETSFVWKPHEKSMTLGRLASHIAELPARCATIITTEQVVRQPGTAPWAAASTAELLAKFDATTAEARTALAGLGEDQLPVVWSIKMGDRTLASLPRVMALRRVFMNHLIHHRAQLGVFLRLIEVAIPGTYGPSADEPR